MKPLSEMGRYATVVIDPPWDIELGWTPGLYKNGHYPQPYTTMTLSDIGALRVADVLAEDATVFCWTTQRFLPATFDILQGWGLTYAFTMTWIKNGGINPIGRPQYNSEFAVTGVKGRLQFQTTRGFDTAMSWPRAEHSAKPEGFYDLLRRVTPGPRLDIFGRRRIAGFDSWGNEAPDVPALPDHYQQVLLG